jgi:threonylcarbamoyladenosine tRNA methylthiotransferase MtaB
MATPRTVAFHTLGCKLNYAETSSVKRLFEKDGYTVVPYEEEADVYILNTCSVTENADRECRKSVRQVHRQNPQARVVVMGCYAQLKPKEIAEIEGVNLVLGAAEKFNVLEYLHALESVHDHAAIHAGEIHLADTFHPAHSYGDRTRTFLKVQDGCDYKCTFCTIPKARGQSRSAEIHQVIKQAKDIGASGVNEIVLTGVNIGDFGNGTSVIEGTRPKKDAMFIDLIKALDEVEEINRFRISSIEPNLCTDEIISFVASSQRFMPHFHMPLQSGNNEILKKMRRRYLRELYSERVRAIKELMPHACIGVDVITGFPGESDAHFMDTYNFLGELDIDYIHAFTYSERADTPASLMPEAVPLHVRRERSQKLRDLSLVKKELHYAKHLGQTRNVLFEKGPTDHTLSGFTDNYVRIIMPFDPSLLNTIQPTLLTRILKSNNEIFTSASLPSHKEITNATVINSFAD